MLITITGASASGKSSISEFLCSLDKNIVHLNIDTVGHEILDMPEIKKVISEKFNLNIKEDKINRKAKRVDDRRKSKFSEKYHERIRSIQTSEKKREQNIRRIERGR